MSNWISNVATVYHLDKKIMRNLRSACTREEDPTFIQYIRPGPHDGEPDAEEWRLQNWGTKSGEVDLVVERIGYSGLLLRFDTAGGPPYDLYQFMKEQGYVIFAHTFEPRSARFGFWADGESHFEESDEASAYLKTALGAYVYRLGKAAWVPVEDSEEEGDDWVYSLFS